jgi:hypothetical protein
MAVVTFALFAIARGRDYYTAPIYPMLMAAGATFLVGLLKPIALRWSMVVAVTVFIIAGTVMASVVLPIAPVGSRWWRYALDQNGDLKEEIGWPELVAETARVWNTIPEGERQRTAIFCSNYGEAGAINLYGSRYGLPQAISPVNSFWARGYGNSPPEVVIVLGGRRERLEQRFESVIEAGRIPNPLGVDNEESGRPEIYVCRRPRQSWPELWSKIRSFG